MRIGGKYRIGLLALAALAAILPATSAGAEATVPYAPGESVGYQKRRPRRPPGNRRAFLVASYPIIAAGRVFVVANGPAGTQGSYLHALDAASGANVWGPIPLTGWAALTYGDGRLYAVNGDGLLRAFDPATGAQRWIRDLVGQYSFSSEPTYSNGIVYVRGAAAAGPCTRSRPGTAGSSGRSR